MRRLLFLMAILSFASASLVAAPGPTASASGAGTAASFRVLVFSRTAGFRHDSIPDGIAAIRKLGERAGFTVDATEDAAQFNAQNLARYRVVVFLSTTGDVLNLEQQTAFEQYIRTGGGFAGIHAASDTEYEWPWYAGLVGAQFASHPHIQEAVLHVEDRTHPSTKMLPRNWVRLDEWYNFRQNPRGKVRVLVTLDETTYQNGGMGADHPAAWYHEYDGGFAWYTAGGHTKASFTEPLFVEHMLGGIRWAAGVDRAKTPAGKPAKTKTPTR